MPLTPRQRRFVDEYLQDLNATKAAVRAGYSAKTAHSAGPRLLEDVGVRSAIDKANAARQDRVKVSADDVLRELLRILNTDIGEAFNPAGGLKPIHEIPTDLRRAISGVEVEEIWDGAGKDRFQAGELKKVKLWSKTTAAELLGKHLKLYTDKIEHSGNVSVAVNIKRTVRAR